jgi:hypothetical protein
MHYLLSLPPISADLLLGFFFDLEDRSLVVSRLHSVTTEKITLSSHLNENHKSNTVLIHFGAF